MNLLPIKLIQAIALLLIVFFGVIPKICAWDPQFYAYSPDNTVRASWEEIRFEEGCNSIVIIENLVENQWIKVQELNVDSKISWVAFSNNGTISELVLQIITPNFRTTWRLIDGQWTEWQRKSLASIIEAVKNREFDQNLFAAPAGTDTIRSFNLYT